MNSILQSHIVRGAAALAAVAAMALSIHETRADDTAAAVEVRGQVVLHGVPPAEREIPLNRDCANHHPDGLTTRFYRAGANGELADVTVFISAGVPPGPWPIPNDPAVLTLSGCWYEQPISAARAGQVIQVRNASPILHNAHITPRVPGNQTRNLAIFPDPTEIEFKLDHPELHVRLKCDVHPWEMAYVSVFDHPFFAITDEAGHFQLPPLPPGTYTLEARHRQAGTHRQEIQVHPGMAPVKTELTVPKPPAERVAN